jgi:osmotically-inducible protein OsmY
MTTTTIKTDVDIQRDVLQELAWDPRVNRTDVGVEVKQGVVALVGTIDSYAKKQAACDAAHRVPGVLDVANDLEVRIPSPWAKNDTDIAHAVRNALVWDVFVPDQQIKSTVTSGWVTLEGQMDTAYQREDAMHVVERLSGVRGVTNLLTVKTKTVDAAKIRASIEEALKRQSERETKRIQIQVSEGLVTLSGTVRSWAEKNAIESVASFAPGVRSIKNKLVIDSFR